MSEIRDRESTSQKDRDSNQVSATNSERVGRTGEQQTMGTDTEKPLTRKQCERLRKLASAVDSEDGYVLPAGVVVWLAAQAYRDYWVM